MKGTVKLGVVLLLFSAVSAALLSVVNGMTAPTIAENELKTTLESYSAIYGDVADDFERMDEGKLEKIKSKHPNIQDIFIAKKGEDIVGYGINVSSNGFGGEMTNAIGFVNKDKTIAGFRNIVNAETKGFGTEITEEYYYSTYNGKDASGPIEISQEPKEKNEVLWISGATVSSKAVKVGVDEAITVFNELLAE